MKERERNICKEKDSNQQSIMNEMLAKIKGEATPISMRLAHRRLPANIARIIGCC